VQIKDKQDQCNGRYHKLEFGEQTS